MGRGPLRTAPSASASLPSAWLSRSTVPPARKGRPVRVCARPHHTGLPAAGAVLAPSRGRRVAESPGPAARLTTGRRTARPSGTGPRVPLGTACPDLLGVSLPGSLSGHSLTSLTQRRLPGSVPHSAAQLMASCGSLLSGCPPSCTSTRGYTSQLGHATAGRRSPTEVKGLDTLTCLGAGNESERPQGRGGGAGGPG